MSDPKYRTSLQTVAALLHYLGLPMEVVCDPKSNRCEFLFPMSISKETCAGTVDYEVSSILRRFHAGECEVADTKTLLDSMSHVLKQMAKAKQRVGAA